MNPFVLGSLISAGGSLLGGLFGSKSTSSANQANLTAQERAARYGIRWRVEDAEKAGLHPLAALGMTPINISPSHVGQDYSYIGRMGQDIGRAIASQKTSSEKRIDAIKLLQEEELLKNMKLKNVGLMREVSNVKQISMPSLSTDFYDRYFNIPGQSNGTGQMSTGEPGSQLIPSQIPFQSKPGYEAGIAPEERFVVDSQGNVSRYPSSVVEESMESSPYHAGKYTFKRLYQHGKSIYHVFKRTKKGNEYIKKFQPKKKLPPGYIYKFNPWSGDFYIKKRSIKDRTGASGSW